MPSEWLPEGSQKKGFRPEQQNAVEYEEEEREHQHQQECQQL